MFLQQPTAPLLHQPDPPGNPGVESQQQDQQQQVIPQPHAQGQVSASQTADLQGLREENVISSQVHMELFAVLLQRSSQENLPRVIHRDLGF